MAYTKEPLTPSAVNKYLKTVLEKDPFLKQLYITGELSNLKYHSNGNIYFSIKDDNGQINCIMFKNYKLQLTDTFKEGDKVEIIGSIYTYVKMGQYNINVVKMRKVGIGDLYQQYLELKNQFQKKGYFDEIHKQNIPEYPHKIGVITSPTGAAVQDVITTIKRRYPQAKIVVIPTLVQGQNAYKDIVKNIKRANEIGDFDTLIVGRGGGSIEDLWSFNEKEVVEAIFESTIPIISAVGHETDFTIADFVADKRAPTPTAAAEMATPNINELSQNLNKVLKQMTNDLKGKISFNKEKLRFLKSNQYMQNPLMDIQLGFDYLSKSLFAETKILKNKIDNTKIQLDSLNEGSIKSIKLIINDNKLKLEHQKENIDNLNPLSILSKGYTTVQKDNKYIKSVKNVKVDDTLEIDLKDGKVMTKVTKIKENNAKG